MPPEYGTKDYWIIQLVGFFGFTIVMFLFVIVGLVNFSWFLNVGLVLAVLMFSQGIALDYLASTRGVETPLYLPPPQKVVAAVLFSVDLLYGFWLWAVYGFGFVFLVFPFVLSPILWGLTVWGRRSGYKNRNIQ
ncbi:MAG: hypothetical protein ACXACA_06635 [Candidatus Ranarchaeia archaeon]|jgi:hypothetical protein